ncbi:MAG: hypothetical protein Q7V62_14300, partial [Actinomycetota bacterium]|nr:hypothetical protein [Actinomycetota bacterium]
MSSPFTDEEVRELSASPPAGNAKKRKRGAAAAAASAAPLPPLTVPQAETRRTLATEPRFELIADVLRGHDHIGSSACGKATQKMVAAAAESRKKPGAPAVDVLRGSTLLREPLHSDAAGVVPGTREFERLRARLHTPLVRIAGQAQVPTASDVAHLLRVSELALPLHGASFESALL